MTEQNTTDIIDENKLIAERRAKLDKLREGSISNGHPNRFRRTHLAADLKAEHGEKSQEELAEQKLIVSVAGRAMRRGGPFVGIQDSSDRSEEHTSELQS